MIGDILAWILGIAAAAVLAAGVRSREKKRREYHQRLIREFTDSEAEPEE